MIVIKEKNKCCGCQACFNACPCNAIQMKVDKEGFCYPDLNHQICVNCGLCERVCPEVNLCKCDGTQSKVYACYRKDYQKRLQSQSGGAFAVLAEKVIDQGGVVFGAAFDNTWKLCHKVVDNKVDLVALQGSKYVQSDMGHAYSKAEQYLKDGIAVLFSGTPCQIQGLKNYLGIEYDKLITVDLICHGVSSPTVWENYLKEFSCDDELVGFIQKDKKNNNSCVFTFAQRGVVVSDYENNPFIKGFSQNLYLRPSCYQCSFKGIERCSDITLGDFWGVEKFYPEFGDKYGISAVITHSSKGQEAFNSVKNELNWITCEQNMLTPENPCLVTSVPLNDKRQRFFEIWEDKGMIMSVQELTGLSLFQKFSKVLRPIKWYALAVVKKVRKKKS